MDGISDTNTEEQILLSLDVLKEDLQSLRTDVKQRFDRVESDIKEVRKDVKQRFDRVESDIKEITETLREMKGRN